MRVGSDLVGLRDDEVSPVRDALDAARDGGPGRRGAVVADDDYRVGGRHGGLLGIWGHRQDGGHDVIAVGYSFSQRLFPGGCIRAFPRCAVGYTELAPDRVADAGEAVSYAFVRRRTHRFLPRQAPRALAAQASHGLPLDREVLPLRV